MEELAIETSIALATGGELKLPVAEILAKPKEWHDGFDLGWGKESFHNWQHVVAVREAVDKYMERIDQHDPLKVKKSLTKAIIAQGELDEAFAWAIAVHDNGNIMKGVKIKNDILVPDYHDEFVYKSEGAEERSKEIARVLIESSDMDQAKKQRFIPFVQHLIEETTYMGDLNQPFARFITDFKNTA